MLKKKKRRLWKFVRQRVFPSAAAETVGRTKLPSSVCSSVTYGAWESSSPDSSGGGGREDPLAQHRSIIVWKYRKVKFQIHNWNILNPRPYLMLMCCHGLFWTFQIIPGRFDHEIWRNEKKSLVITRSVAVTISSTRTQQHVAMVRYPIVFACLHVRATI